MDWGYHMIPFTLYCFAKVFNLSYSGSSPKLLSLFGEGISPEALTKVVYGKTDSAAYAERIDLSGIKAQNTLKTLRIDRLRFAYQFFIEQEPDTPEKEDLVNALLEYALLREKEEQADVYDRKDTEEVRQFILQLRDMVLQNDDCGDAQNNREQPVQTASPSRSELKTAGKPDMAHMTTQAYFDYIEAHFDEITTLEISCHAGDIWLQPSSFRYRLLKRLSDKGIPINVIINSLPATEIIWQHMRDTEAYEMGMYRSIEDVTNAWKIMSASRKSITVKACDIPLLHNFLCVSFHSDPSALMRIGMYTYGKPLEESHPHLYFTDQDAHFAIMKNEYAYLWEISVPI